jgi:hypothetical protein
VVLAGSCPISPLALPRRLTDGCLATAAALGNGSGAPSALATTISSVAVAVGAAEAYPGAADGRQQQQRSPMRKRIVNLTAIGQHAAMLPRSATASPEPVGSQQGLAGSGSGSPVAPAAGTGATAAGGSKSLHVLSGMHFLMASNPALPVGMRSQLRASAPSNSQPPAGFCDK